MYIQAKNLEVGMSLHGTPILEELNTVYVKASRTSYRMFRLECPDCGSTFERRADSLTASYRKGNAPKCNHCSKNRSRKSEEEKAVRELVSPVGFTNTHPIIGMIHEKLHGLVLPEISQGKSN